MDPHKDLDFNIVAHVELKEVLGRGSKTVGSQSPMNI
jgi:hypothetical protein